MLRRQTLALCSQNTKHSQPGWQQQQSASRDADSARFRSNGTYPSSKVLVVVMAVGQTRSQLTLSWCARSSRCHPQWLLHCHVQQPRATSPVIQASCCLRYGSLAASPPILGISHIKPAIAQRRACCRAACKLEFRDGLKEHNTGCLIDITWLIALHRTMLLAGCKKHTCNVEGLSHLHKSLSQNSTRIATQLHTLPSLTLSPQQHLAGDAYTHPSCVRPHFVLHARSWCGSCRLSPSSRLLWVSRTAWQLCWQHSRRCCMLTRCRCKQTVSTCRNSWARRQLQQQ